MTAIIAATANGGMTMGMLKDEHPCDLCERDDCWDCALQNDLVVYPCNNYECRFEYEGSCNLGIYSRCGAWKEKWDG